MSTLLNDLTIAHAADLLRTRKISPVELTEALLNRIARLDTHVQAFITVAPEVALAQARAAEAEISAGRYRGPMHGIPCGLKDIYNTAGIRTTAHSKICANNVPRDNATAVARLYEAGAVLLGKLATHEFATSGPMFDLPWPPARNPWNLDHITGGSSSGSAAAVAAGMALGALGSDTGGSIRIPAGFCGVVGLKPTYGRVSCHGVIPNSWTLDHCGPMTRTVEDCAIMLAAIAGYDPQDAASADEPVPDYRTGLSEGLRGMRIGVVRHFWEEDMHPGRELGSMMDAALDVLSHLGAKLETVRMRPLQQYFDVRIAISESELLALHQDELIRRPHDFGREFLTRTAACVYSAVDYIRAQRERRRMLDEMKPLYERYDALVTAGSGAAPRIDAPHAGRPWLEANSYIYTPFNVTAGPALALCAGFSEHGLPLGMQIAGQPFDEATVLRVAHAYEQATPWHRERPQVEAKVPTLWPDVGPPHNPESAARPRNTSINWRSKPA
ncbi:MAG: amidase [Betaproteobacteria bacterium]|nr:amidase [Betaproteobacteria bacterium]